MEKTMEILFSGRVQKVGFRSYIRETAVSLGLTGETENLPDGRVHVIITGEEALIEKFIALTYNCPRAVIRNVSEQEYVYTEFPNFTIKRE